MKVKKKTIIKRYGDGSIDDNQKITGSNIIEEFKKHYLL